MAVDITTLGWGTVQDRAGEAQSGVAFALKRGVTTVLSGTTNASGQIVGMIDEGEYTLTIGGVDKTVSAFTASGYYAAGTPALRTVMASLTNPDPFTFGTTSVMTTDGSATNQDAGFFALNILHPGNAHCAIQGVMRNTVAGGSGWGINTLAETNQDHTTLGLGVWAGEFDVNFNGSTNSDTIWAGAQNVRGVSVASGGTKRPQYAYGVEKGTGKAPFVYGIRFASDSSEAAVWDGGADLISQVQTVSHTLWAAHILEEPNPRFRLRPDRIEMGPGGGTALDVMLRREAAGQWTTDTTALHAWQVYAENSVEVRGTAGNGFLQLHRQTSNPAGVALETRLFSRFNGTKEELCVRFPSGAAVVVATEP